jgi:hypothetical protein
VLVPSRISTTIGDGFPSLSIHGSPGLSPSSIDREVCGTLCDCSDFNVDIRMEIFSSPGYISNLLSPRNIFPYLVMRC